MRRSQAAFLGTPGAVCQASSQASIANTRSGHTHGNCPQTSCGPSPDVDQRIARSGNRPASPGAILHAQVASQSGQSPPRRLLAKAAGRQTALAGTSYQLWWCCINHQGATLSTLRRGSLLEDIHRDRRREPVGIRSCKWRATSGVRQGRRQTGRCNVAVRALQPWRSGTAICRCRRSRFGLADNLLWNRLKSLRANTRR